MLKPGLPGGMGYRYRFAVTMSEPAFAHDVFLSHNAMDKAMVRAVAERLRADGHRAFTMIGGKVRTATL